MDKKNIFVVGLDSFNEEELRKLRNADRYNYHALFTHKELNQAAGGSFNAFLRQAKERLRAFDGSIDAIVAFWDFPAESLAPLLCQLYGLPGPSIESVEKCEHKYWSRLEQKKSIPEYTPPFCIIDPFDPHAADEVTLGYPFWLKPVKSFSSYLGYKIHNRKELESSLKEIRHRIPGVSGPFNELLEHVNLPAEIAAVNGNYCIAEKIISGLLCTLEGYVHNGEVEIYGIVDSIRDSHHASFTRYQYPSHLPRSVQAHMTDAAKRVMTHIGYDGAPFNIEFFYNKALDHIYLLEINPRISQSHCELFRKVDGDSHHEVMINLALGNKPAFPRREGEFKLAGKFFLRHYGNAWVHRVPHEADIAKLQETIPDARIHVIAQENEHLSDLPIQDSYSFELAEIFIGAQDQHSLLEKYRKCAELLPFDLEPTEKKHIQTGS